MHKHQLDPYISRIFKRIGRLIFVDIGIVVFCFTQIFFPDGFLRLPFLPYLVPSTFILYILYSFGVVAMSILNIFKYIECLQYFKIINFENATCTIIEGSISNYFISDSETRAVILGYRKKRHNRYSCRTAIIYSIPQKEFIVLQHALFRNKEHLKAQEVFRLTKTSSHSSF